jgi:hypothetical protein
MKNLLCLILFSTLLCCKGPGTGTAETVEKKSIVKIDPSIEKGIVDPKIMGFNIVYSYAPDSIWDRGDGKIPLLLEKLGTKILRYPGGTVVTHFHWEEPTGQGWVDNWDPSFDPSQNSPESEFMDIDEYLDVCQKRGIEPLVGINLGSGKKYNRVDDGIEEARQLMRHFQRRGMKVRYFYLDNEPYHKTANFVFTAEEYGDMVNQYVKAMKEIDNEIEIIVNSHPRNFEYTMNLIEEAGENIDFIDIHYYWNWGNATYENWKSQKVMEQGSTNLKYRDQRSFYLNIADSLGYPEIDLVALEWNIGRTGSGNVQPTEAEAALMVGEQFMQFIQSGMPMATFWPVSWPQKTQWSNRALLDAQRDYEPNKVYEMFKMYESILGQQKVASFSSDEGIQTLGVMSQNRETLWVYLINKNSEQTSRQVDLELNDVPTYVVEEAVGFDADDSIPTKLNIKTLNVRKVGPGKFNVIIPKFSFAKVTFVKEAKNDY